MELRLFKKSNEIYTRIKLNIKQEGESIIQIACILGEPIKANSVYTYFESKGDLADTKKLLGLI